jgi:hypothetical protein
MNISKSVSATASGSKATPSMKKPWPSPFFLVRPERDPPPGQPQALVSSKILRADVVLVNDRAHKHCPHAGNHGERSSAVRDGAQQCNRMPGHHLSVDHNHLALPFFIGFRHFCHGADQVEVGIRLFQVLQSKAQNFDRPLSYTGKRVESLSVPSVSYEYTSQQRNCLSRELSL